MNKRQLITMWVGILLCSFVWYDDYEFDAKTFIPIIAVVTIGLIISFSNRNYKVVQEIFKGAKNWAFADNENKSEDGKQQEK